MYILMLIKKLIMIIYLIPCKVYLKFIISLFFLLKKIIHFEMTDKTASKLYILTSPSVLNVKKIKIFNS